MSEGFEPFTEEQVASWLKEVAADGENLVGSDPCTVPLENYTGLLRTVQGLYKQLDEAFGSIGKAGMDLAARNVSDAEKTILDHAWRRIKDHTEVGGSDLEIVEDTLNEAVRLCVRISSGELTVEYLKKILGGK